MAMATDEWESVKYIEYTVLHSTVADWRYNTAPSETTPTLFLASFDSISILTCNDFYLWSSDMFVRFHLERRIFH